MSAKSNPDDATRRDGEPGRDDSREASLADSTPSREGEVQAGTGRRSVVTGRHDAGSDANNTIDGLTSSEEMVRQAAEDVPTGRPNRPTDNIPVFDRGRLPPKA